jgi:hypothetical protein
MPMLVLLILQVLLSEFVSAEQDYAQYVNVFAGTTNGGNMFPGVTAGKLNLGRESGPL